MASTRGPQPTGECWRRCGGKTKPKRFFLPNHDRVAESAVMKVVYGGIPQFLAAYMDSGRTAGIPGVSETSWGEGLPQEK